MLDIGCYPVTTTRFVTGRELTRVVATLDRDPVTGVDRLGSAVLNFPGMQASFAYGTQMFAYQRMTFVEVIEVPACNQYTVATDAFAAAVLSGAPAPVSLEDSVRNMRVLDALVRSAEDGAWQAM
jgi:predicted dehydrogenase